MEVLIFLPAVLMLILAGVMIAEGLRPLFPAKRRIETPKMLKKTQFEDDLAALLGYQIHSREDDAEEGE